MENEDENDAMDIIDAALADDDTDYGDDSPATIEVETNVITSGGDDEEADGGDESNVALEPAAPTSVPEVKPEAQQPEQVNAQQQQEAIPAGLTRVGNAFADKQGNIVDKEGKVIAQSGVQARLWGKASRAESLVQQRDTQINALRQQAQQSNELLQQAERISNIPRDLGLNEQQYKEGLTYMQRFAQGDALGVAKEVVAIALSAGHNVTDILGDSAGNAIEMSAVQRMISDATAPMRQQHEAQAAQQQQQQETSNVYNNFITKYPDAVTHGEDIAYLMGKGMSATDAYYNVKNYAASNGLDFSQPLKQQVEALQSQQNRQGANNPQTPMIRGGGANNSQQPVASGMASPTDSYADIIRAAMQT